MKEGEALEVYKGRIEGDPGEHYWGEIETIIGKEWENRIKHMGYVE